MSFFGDLWKVFIDLLDRGQAGRAARITTQTHISEMRKVVDTALLHGKWPPAAPTERWESAWAENRKVLLGGRKDHCVVDSVFGFVEEFKKGLHAGERKFDTTTRNPGEDKDFFERFRSTLDKADRALA